MKVFLMYGFELMHLFEFLLLHYSKIKFIFLKIYYLILSDLSFNLEKGPINIVIASSRIRSQNLQLKYSKWTHWLEIIESPSLLLILVKYILYWLTIILMSYQYLIFLIDLKLYRLKNEIKKKKLE